MNLLRKAPLEGFVFGESTKFGMLVALAWASGVTPKKLADAFAEDEKLGQYARSFVAELVRKGADELDAVQNKAK